MHKKLKLLKNWAQTTTYLAATSAFILFTGPLSAGYIYDGNDDNNGNPRRLVQVVFGKTNATVDQHPDPKYTQQNPAAPSIKFKAKDWRIALYMRDTLPQITGETHVQFWCTQNNGDHITYYNLAKVGVQANAHLHNIAHNLLTFERKDK
jgi:hypothetical protein